MSAVGRFLDLGSGHLPRVDRERLDEAVRFGGLGAPSACMAGPYGWFVHVPDDTAVGAWDGTPALAAILAHARALGCDHVLIDADGPVDDALPWFDEE